MNKPQIDKRVVAIFQALLQEHGKDRADWCEAKAKQARVILEEEARRERARKRAA